MAYAPIPTGDPIAVPADPKNPLSQRLPKLRLGDKFQRWLSGLSAQVDLRAARQGDVVRLQNQNASIAVTALPIGTVVQGIWRISVTVRVTTAAGVASTIQGHLHWSEGGVTQQDNTTNLAGNLTTTREGKVFIIRTDDAQPISYSTTYTSNPANAMRYSLDIVAELLHGDTSV
jgi:hypothetical protein